MPIPNNHQFYTTVDELGLVFVKCNSFNDAVTKIDNTKYRLGALNREGLRFVSAMNIRHSTTDLPVVISIFEETK